MVPPLCWSHLRLLVASRGASEKGAVVVLGRGLGPLSLIQVNSGSQSSLPSHFMLYSPIVCLNPLHFLLAVPQVSNLHSPTSVLRMLSTA